MSPSPSMRIVVTACSSSSGPAICTSSSGPRRYVDRTWLSQFTSCPDAPAANETPTRVSQAMATIFIARLVFLSSCTTETIRRADAGGKAHGLLLHGLLLQDFQQRLAHVVDLLRGGGGEHGEGQARVRGCLGVRERRLLHEMALACVGL